VVVPAARAEPESGAGPVSDRVSDRVAVQAVDRVVEQAVVVELEVAVEPAAVAGQVVDREAGLEAVPLQLQTERRDMCPGCSFHQSRTREG
jgi:hypothetical protein